MGKKDDTLSAYDALLQLQASTWEQVDKIKAEIEQVDATIVDLDVKAEETLLLSKDVSKIEAEQQRLQAHRANLEKRIAILESASGSDIFVDTARKAIDENTEALRAVNAEWQAAVAELEKLHRAYLEVVRKFRPIENRSSTLLSQREYAHKMLPKGTPFMWAEGVAEPTRIQQQGGPIFRCLDVAAIKTAYES